MRRAVLRAARELRRQPRRTTSRPEHGLQHGEGIKMGLVCHNCYRKT